MSFYNPANPIVKPNESTIKETEEDPQTSDANIEHLKQVSSVLRILGTTFEKLKISLILPKILDNAHILRKHLTKNEFTECVGLLQSYLKDREKRKRKDSLDYLNLRLIRVIDFFHEKCDVLKYFTKWLGELSEDDANVLKAFELLLEISEQRLSKSAFLELDREHKIREVFQEKEIFEKRVEEYETQMRSQKLNLRWKLAAKEGVIKRHEELIARKKETNNALIKEEMLKSSRAIRHMHTASVGKQRELEEELKMAKSNYEAILSENLKHEKTTRDEKNKLVLQVEALIQKYDQSIGDKLREKMALEEEYEKQRKLFDKFMVTFKEKEAEYDVIVRQKLEEELRIQEEKITLFTLNRAARIIQRFYRRYLKQEKRQLKKTKGDKNGKGGKGAKRGKAGKAAKVTKADKGDKASKASASRASKGQKK